MEFLSVLPTGGETIAIGVSAVAGLLVAGVAMLFKAYSNPSFALLARIPWTGISPEKYDLPTDSERAQLAQYLDLDGMDVRVDRRDSEKPTGEVDGFQIGPVGVAGIIMTADAFEDQKYLSALATHELGHIERGDPLTNAKIVAKSFGLLISGGILTAVGLIWSQIGGSHLSLAALGGVALLWGFWEPRQYGAYSQSAEFDADRRSVAHLGSQENLRALLKKYESSRETGPTDSTTLTDLVFGPEHHPHPTVRLEQLDTDAATRQHS